MVAAITNLVDDRMWRSSKTDLCHEHCSGWNFHIVTELEVLKEGNCLCHTYVTINLEAHISNRISRIDVSYDIFCDDV